MTLEQLIARESIRDTIAVASRSGDHLISEDYSNCFTPDGVLEFGDVMRQVGREEIHAWVERAKLSKKRGLMRHNVTTSVITLNGPDSAPESADVRSYFHVYSDAGPDHFGWYEDSCVPFEGRWLLKRRIVGLDWWSPEGRFVPKSR